MRLLADVLRALEHDVLEEVRESRAARLLAHRPHVVPEVHGYQSSQWSSDRITSKPFGSLYFSYLSCGQFAGLLAGSRYREAHRGSIEH